VLLWSPPEKLKSSEQRTVTKYEQLAGARKVRQLALDVPDRLGLSLPRTVDPHPPPCFPPCLEFQYPGRYNRLFSKWSVVSPGKHDVVAVIPARHALRHRLRVMLHIEEQVL